MVIAALGFLLKEVILNEAFKGGLEAFGRVKSFFGGGLIFLAISAALALIHRYVSSDCIAYQVRYLRLKSVRDEFLQKEGSSSEFASKRNADMEQEKKDLGTQLKRGKYTLFATAIALGVGMGLISFGLSKTIFSQL